MKTNLTLGRKTSSKLNKTAKSLGVPVHWLHKQAVLFLVDSTSDDGMVEMIRDCHAKGLDIVSTESR